MAVTTTALGFQKPDGGEAVRNGDDVIRANADKAEQRFQEDRSRLSAVEALNLTQNGRLDTAESKNATQDGRLTANESATAALTGRVTATESKNTAQDGRLTGVEAKNAAQDGRLASVESKNTAQDGRLNTVEGKVTAITAEQTVQNGRLAQVENAAGFNTPPLTLSDQVVAALIADTGSVTRAGLNSRYSGVFVASVDQYGAKGDGTTEDTAAVQAAVNAIATRGGGILYYPKKHGAGIYRQGPVNLTSNLKIVSDRATILSTGYDIFRALSGTAQGYGSSVRNVSFEGINFSGDFAAGVDCAMSLHHVENMTFRDCIWQQANGGGHALDFGGCRNILIDNCRFQGFKVYAGSPFAELIQLDHSYAAGMSNKDNAASYDGLPCENVTIRNSFFEPLTVGGVTYPAPNPLGAHVQLASVHKNVKFINNVVERGAKTGTSNAYTGWIHFFGIDGFEASGNKFISDGPSSKVLQFTVPNAGIAAADYANPTPNYNNAAVTARPPKNIRIIDNEFTGFSSEDGLAVITITGHSVTAVVQDVVIRGNRFTDCYPTAPTTPNVASDLILTQYTDNVSIERNTVRNCRRLIYARSSTNMRFSGNKMYAVAWNTSTFETGCDGLTVDDNLFSDFGGGINIDTAVGVTVRGNTLKGLRAATSYAVWWAGSIRLTGTTQTIVAANLVASTTPSQPNGIHLAGTNTRGYAKDNIVIGYTAAVLADSGSSTITIAGTIT